MEYWSKGVVDYWNLPLFFIVAAILDRGDGVTLRFCSGQAAPTLQKIPSKKFQTLEHSAPKGFDVGISKDFPVGGDQREVVNPGGGDNDLTGQVSMKPLWKSGRFYGDPII